MTYKESFFEKIEEFERISLDKIISHAIIKTY